MGGEDIAHGVLPRLVSPPTDDDVLNAARNQISFHQSEFS